MAGSQLAASAEKTVHSPHEPLVTVLKSVLIPAHGQLATYRDEEIAVHLAEVDLVLSNRVRTIDQAENSIPLTKLDQLRPWVYHASISPHTARQERPPHPGLDAIESRTIILILECAFRPVGFDSPV